LIDEDMLFYISIVYVGVKMYSVRFILNEQLTGV